MTRLAHIYISLSISSDICIIKRFDLIYNQNGKQWERKVTVRLTGGWCRKDIEYVREDYVFALCCVSQSQLIMYCVCVGVVCLYFYSPI